MNRLLGGENVHEWADSELSNQSDSERGNIGPRRAEIGSFPANGMVLITISAS